MRILFVAPYIPSNIRIRPYNFIKGLSKKGHTIFFIGLKDAYADESIISELQKYCVRVEIHSNAPFYSYFNCTTSLFKQIPLQAAYCYTKKMKRRIDGLLSYSYFDVIHVEHIRSSYFLPSKRKIPAIFDSVDCVTSLYKMFRSVQSPILKRLVAMIEYEKLKNAEPKVLSMYDRIIVTTVRDKQYLEKLSKKNTRVASKIDPITNGVDYKYFKPDKSFYNPYSIVFSGKMGYYANELAVIHFVKKIFPIVKLKFPKTKFYIVGANPSRKIMKLKSNSDIIVTGWVPDIRKYLNLAHVIVCPVRVSVGIQNKMLEALSMGKAVIAYPEVSSPLKKNNSEAYLISHQPNGFAENILKVFKSCQLRIKLEKNSRNFIKSFYSWEKSVQKLEKIYTSAIEEYQLH